jgi:hypothetical protein
MSLTGSSFSNSGTVRADGAGAGLLFNFDNWRIEDVETATRSGGAVFVIGGTLDNAGRTFHLDANSGPWQIAGTVRGGTISVADGYTLFSPPYAGYGLDNVFVHGQMHAGSAGRVWLHDGVLRGDGEVTFPSRVLEGPARLLSLTDSIRIDDGMTARFRGIPVFDEDHSGIGDPDERKPIRIDGTAAVNSLFPPSANDKPVEFLMFGDVTNSGTISQGLHSRWRIDGNLTALADSTLKFELQTTPGKLHHPMIIEGAFDLTALGDRVEIVAPPGLEFGRTFVLATTEAPVVLGGADQFTHGFFVYSLNNQLIARVVPEPASAAALAVLSAFAGMRRTRKINQPRCATGYGAVQRLSAF